MPRFLLRRFLAMLGFVLIPAVVLAASDTYQNDGIVISPPDIAPTVDATNFVNTGTFEIDDVLYTTSHTRNYTNTGTINAFLGFYFQYFPGGYLSANFFNSGEIDGGIGPAGTTPVRMLVSATNITVPGNINIASDSLLDMNGMTVDLNESVITMLSGSTLPGGGAVSGLDYGAGVSPVTNIFAWNPAGNLSPTFASSSVFTNVTAQNLEMALNNSVPYFSTNQTATNYVINRSVFLQNNNPALGTRVFIQQDGANGGGFGRVEWTGTYLDPATGALKTNYLYLTDILTTTANSTFNNGIPSGYSFAQNNGTPLFGGAAIGQGMPTGVFQSENVTNTYAYVSVEVIPTSASTNDNITYNVTNLPGRIQISSSKFLNLGAAQITGPNYLELNCTNQFNGNNGSSISAGFADFRLGVTNGFLTISNLWKPTLPRWSGTIQAWNTRWFGVVIKTDTTFITNADLTITTNTVATSVTNDYRVLLVNSTLIPSSTTYVQDLILHSTNSLIISDVFNVYRALSIDAQRLTLTTNIFGTGADSPDGELNILTANLTWAGSVPRLRWLTNNGAIRILGAGSPSQNFGNSLSGSNYLALINRGRIVTPGSTIWADNFENSGIISNTAGSLTLHSLTARATNGSIVATGDITLFSGSLSSSGLALRTARTLTLTITNLLTDNDVTNGSIWNVGSTTGSGGSGLIMTVKPPLGDLRGTTINVFAPPPNKTIANIWAGEDRQVSNSGFTNNAAVGKLILDPLASSKFSFSGLSGISNAIYVDYLELRDYATNRDVNGNFPALIIADNIVIYYAQAIMNGASIAEKMDGKNNGHLRWVSSYAGKFSSKNIVIDGKTNAVNAALAQSTIIDSDGDGTPNVSDTTPFFSPGQMNLTVTLTNVPPLTAMLNWMTVPNATNYVEFKTNLFSGGWIPLTNFISPNPYPGPATNVSVLDRLNVGGMRFYRVLVNPWVTYPY